MEYEEAFKIIFWILSGIMFAVALGILLFLQSIYHTVYVKINSNKKISEKIIEGIENPLIVLNEKGLEKLSKNTDKPTSILSEREMEVLLFTLKGYSAYEVADKLNITKRTVERHKENMKGKTDSKNFTGVIYYALSNQLISAENLQNLKNH